MYIVNTNMMLSYGPQLRVERVARYMAELRHIHSVFRAKHLVHYTTELETDLVSLQLHMSPEMPPLVEDPYISQYALYLESLPTHKLLSHWYALVLPLMITPQPGCVVTGPEIPASWVESSAYFAAEDDLWNRTRYTNQLADLTPLQRSEFVEEFAEVSIRLYCLIGLLLV